MNAFGYRAFYARSGPRVTDLVERGVPDLLILADLLGDTNGINVLRSLDVFAYRIPVILATGRVCRENR